MEKQIRRTLKKCLDCGTAFYGGGPDKLYCDECVKKRKSNVIRIRICKMCGAEFPGGPRAYYCPICRKDRQKEANRRARARGGAMRAIGSIDTCEWCGTDYIVTSGRQKFCSEECQKEAMLKWQREHKKGYNNKSGQEEKKKERRKEKQKICIYCEREFQSNTSTNVCSSYCREHQQQISMYKAERNRGANVNLEKLIQHRNEYRKKQTKNATNFVN